MSERIPKGWKKVKLGDAPILIIDGDRGKNYPKKNEFYAKGYCLFLNTKNVTTRGFDFTELNFITKEKDNILRKGKLKKNDIVLTTRGTVGNVAYFNKNIPFENIRINSGMIIIRPNGIEVEFNYQLFKYLKSKLSEFTSGSAQPQLPIRDLKQLEFLLPPLAEQKAIASVLSSLDYKIDLLHRQNKTLEQMAETLFRQWFIEEAKEDWEEVSLGNSNLAKIIKSGIDKFEGEKIYLATGDVNDTEIIGGNKIKYNKRPSRANMQPVKFSVWFAKKGGVRKLLMFDDYSDIDNTILSTGFTGLKTTELSHYYIWCFVLLDEFQEIKDSFVSGTVQPDINNDGVLQIMIPNPDEESLKKFNEIVRPLFTKIQANNNQIRTLEKLRNTLLPKLMSGKVRVKL